LKRSDERTIKALVLSLPLILKLIEFVVSHWPKRKPKTEGK
jgi:hypothetical protein